MTRHIHADLMIQAANDTTIQWDWTYPTEADSGNWFDIPGTPFWEPSLIYRQRPAPHPHQALMDQAKADPSIKWQYKDITGQWLDVREVCLPLWTTYLEYRQKPVMVDMWQWAYRGGDRVYATPEFYTTDRQPNKAEILFRIEGSKISVEVSQ